MRRLLAVLVVCSLALAGCGDVADKGGSVSTGELRKLPGGGWSAYPGAAQGGREEAQPAAADSAPSSLLYPGFRIRYEVAADLPELRGPATAYEANARAGRDDLERLAAAFGIRGKAERIDEHSWQVQEGNRIAYLSTHSLGDWTVSEAPTGGCARAPAGAEIACDTVVPERENQEIPRDLPSAEEAEKRARQLLAEAGVKLADDAQATISEPTIDGLTVSFELRVGRVPVVGLGPSVTLGAKGAVRFASGTFATFDEIGDYPLVGTDEGVKRLQQIHGGAGEVTILGGPEAVSDEQVTAGGSGSSPGYDPECDAEKCVYPEPVPLPEPQEQVHTVEGVEIVLQPAYSPCPGGPVFLVPAYRFLLTGGQVGPILTAVTDEHLDASGAGDRRSPEADIEPCPGRLGGSTEPGTKPDEPVTTRPAKRAADRPASNTP